MASFRRLFSGEKIIRHIIPTVQLGAYPCGFCDLRPRLDISSRLYCLDCRLYTAWASTPLTAKPAEICHTDSLNVDLGAVDVIVCTYNSGATLECCLKSVVENVPVSRLIIIDNFSKDQTETVAAKFRAEFVRFGGGLALSRQLGFTLASTPFVVCVDSDIVLCKDWFRKVAAYYHKGVGIVWGVSIDQNNLYGKFQTALYRFRNPANSLHVPNMLVYKAAVAGLSFPSVFANGSVSQEDHYLYAFVSKRGYAVVTAPVYVQHFHSVDLLKKAYWYGAGERAVGRTDFAGMARSLALNVAKALFCSVFASEPRVFPYVIKYNLNFLKGYLRWTKYLKMDRNVK